MQQSIPRGKNKSVRRRTRRKTQGIRFYRYREPVVSNPSEKRRRSRPGRRCREVQYIVDGRRSTACALLRAHPLTLRTPLACQVSRALDRRARFFLSCTSRRYCGGGGISVPSLDTLWRRALEGDEALESPTDCMLDEAYDEIVESLTLNHLQDYQARKNDRF